MIQQLKLKNFRNFWDKTFDDLQLKNFIIGENGKGKTNSLEALAVLWNTSILNLPLEDLVHIWEDYFFVEIQNNQWESFSLFYEKESKKKKYSINGKKVTKKKFCELSPTCVIFSPIVMNMFYLWPSLRRDFLDSILSRSFWDFDTIKKEYQKIIKSRNATLKAIRDGEAHIENLDFWNKKCISLAQKYYKKRFFIIDFFSKNIEKIQKFLNIDCQNIEFFYQTKVSKNTVEQDIETYFLENQKRDILLAKTPIGPHIDDFFILIDGKDITHLASRGEIKSVIIYLKLLEGIFIENMTKKKPVLLIDDLLSELDTQHKNILLENISYYQTFISNIETGEDSGKIFILP